MTAKSDFTPQEWEQVLEGPPSAGIVVITATRGGTLRETFSMARAYAEARQHHGQSELLDEIVAAKPEIDHTRYHSPQELKEHSLAHLRDAVALLQTKADPQELDQYKAFVMSLAQRVAESHRESGRGADAVSDSERAAISEIEQALGSSVSS
jgi:hypothetical protein